MILHVVSLGQDAIGEHKVLVPARGEGAVVHHVIPHVIAVRRIKNAILAIHVLSRCRCPTRLVVNVQSDALLLRNATSVAEMVK